MVIGTHKLFSLVKQGDSTSVFKNLGLLIIDEEQKFGVRHKEHFKNLYPSIDILTLSATPIPRTLHLGLSKIQSLSQITTAPVGRQSIKTFVLPKNLRTIKEAIEFELARNGQVYFLANRIHKMPALLDEIKKLKITTNKKTSEPLLFESASEPTRTREGLRREKSKDSVVCLSTVILSFLISSNNFGIL